MVLGVDNPEELGSLVAHVTEIQGKAGKKVSDVAFKQKTQGVFACRYYS